MGDKTYGGEFLAGFFVGALAGAAAALLLAPQSGEQTRVLIREKGIELQNRADELGSEARKRADEIQVQAKGKADELQTKVKQAVEEGKAAAAEKQKEMLSELQQEQTTGETPA
jgi:gas vesicle protein